MNTKTVFIFSTVLFVALNFCSATPTADADLDIVSDRESRQLNSDSFNAAGIGVGGNNQGVISGGTGGQGIGNGGGGYGGGFGVPAGIGGPVLGYAGGFGAPGFGTPGFSAFGAPRSGGFDAPVSSGSFNGAGIAVGGDNQGVITRGTGGVGQGK